MAGIPPLSVSGEVYRGSKFSSAGHVGQVAGFGSFPEDRLNFLPVRSGPIDLASESRDAHG